jgi:hypothetical protein
MGNWSNVMRHDVYRTFTVVFSLADTDAAIAATPGGRISAARVRPSRTCPYCRAQPGSTQLEVPSALHAVGVPLQVVPVDQLQSACRLQVYWSRIVLHESGVPKQP